MTSIARGLRTIWLVNFVDYELTDVLDIKVFVFENSGGSQSFRGFCDFQCSLVVRDSTAVGAEFSCPMQQQGEQAENAVQCPLLAGGPVLRRRLYSYPSAGYSRTGQSGVVFYHNYEVRTGWRRFSFTGS
jgi:hypothetical protein